MPPPLPPSWPTQLQAASDIHRMGAVLHARRQSAETSRAVARVLCRRGQSPHQARRHRCAGWSSGATEPTSLFATRQIRSVASACDQQQRLSMTCAVQPHGSRRTMRAGSHRWRSARPAPLSHVLTGPSSARLRARPWRRPPR